MFRLITLIMIIFSLIAPANSEVIQKIVIDGNQRISDETVLVYGKIDLNKKKGLFRKDLNEILQNLYSTNFFEKC